VVGESVEGKEEEVLKVQKILRSLFISARPDYGKGVKINRTRR
jgi:hypothetical protein